MKFSSHAGAKMKISNMNGVEVPKDFKYFLDRILPYVDNYREACQLARLDLAEYLALQRAR